MANFYGSLTGFFAGGVGVTPVSISNTVNNYRDIGGSGETTVTHSSMSVGSATSDRLIVAAFCISGGQANSSSSGATVDGNAMTKIVETVGGDANITSIYSYNLTSGTSVAFTVSYSLAVYGSSLNVWALYDANHTMTDSFGTTANPGTGTLDIEAGGAAVAVAVTSGTTMSTHAWTGLTEDADAQIRGLISSSAASKTFASEETDYTVTVARTYPGSDRSMSVASFGPA